jgi:putative phage-type endonuclease
MINEQILRERKTGIGGSDVAAILGLSRWRTPLDVYLDKTSEELVEQSESEAMYWGNRLEGIVAEEYATRTTVELTEPTEIFRHREHGFLLANPDRLIKVDDGVGILECKTCSAYKASEWGDEGTDQIPTEYLLQVAHYRLVLDAKFVDIAVLIGGNDFRTYRYMKNQRLESKILERLVNFWKENVEPCRPPEPKTRKDVEALLKPTDRVLEADEELQQDLKEMARLKTEERKLSESIDMLQDKVCVRIGDASTVVSRIGEKICTYAEVASRRFNSSLFKKEKPGEYEQYQQLSNSRVFRLNNSLIGG